MKHVGIFEAKTHFSSLIDEVENGEEIMITKHGKPVARLVRAESKLTSRQIEERREAIASLREIGRGLNLKMTQQAIKRSIEEGRR